MQRTTMSGLICGLLLFYSGGVMFASEADEFRERAKSLQKQAAAMAEQGKKDEAQRLEQEVAKLLQTAGEREQKGKPAGQKEGQPGADEAVRRLGQQLGDLLAKERKMREAKVSEPELADVRKQVALTEQELKKVQSIRAEHGEHRPENCPPADQLEAASRRIHHVRVAAENLKLAEMPELSRQLSDKAEAMEREVREAQQRIQAQAKGPHPQRLDQAPDAVRELREEIERLRAEVKGLRQSIEKR